MISKILVKGNMGSFTVVKSVGLAEDRGSKDLCDGRVD